MKYLNRISRRTIVAGNAALAGLAVLPGVTAAKETSAITHCAASGHSANPACRPARWHSATAKELADFVGDRFRVHSPNHGTLVLKLIRVVPGPSDDARPAHLSRRAGVTAIFDSPDKAPLVAEGYGTHRVSHPRIGAADLYLQAVPLENGGHNIEIVLN